MKGVVFNILEEMVLDQYDMQTWNHILQELELEGVYTAGQSYPDEQLFLLVETISEKTGIEMTTLVGAFGEFMFTRLAQKYPIFLESESTLKHFLMSIHDVIHLEVSKLYENPHLPHFAYEELSHEELLMRYTSPRKLCILAEGLIRGAAKYYDQDIELSHPVCMHKGSDHCDLIVRFL